MAHQHDLDIKKALLDISPAEPSQDYAGVSEFTCSTSPEPGDIEF